MEESGCVHLGCNTAPQRTESVQSIVQNLVLFDVIGTDGEEFLDPGEYRLLCFSDSFRDLGKVCLKLGGMV
jgi:hypothetical protein